MIHKKLNKAEYWNNPELLKQKKIDQENIIKKKYTDYQLGDWVLWIIPDIYYKADAKSFTGNIIIKNKYGSTIETSTVLRSPYPNKKIKNISMRNGKFRLYGIPLIFKSFDELCNVSEIIIKWHICDEWEWLKHNESDPFMLHSQTLIVKYILSFERNNVNPKFRFFTVYSKDTLFNPYFKENEFETNKQKTKEYFNQFDFAVICNGHILYDELQQKEKATIYETCTLKDFAITDEIKERKILKNLVSLIPSFQDFKTILTLLSLRNKVDLTLSYYEKTETLKPEYMADFSRGY